MSVYIIGVRIDILAVTVVVLHSYLDLIIICLRMDIKRLFKHAVVAVEDVDVFYYTALVIKLFLRLSQRSDVFEH